MNAAFDEKLLLKKYVNLSSHLLSFRIFIIKLFKRKHYEEKFLESWVHVRLDFRNICRIN